MKYNWRNVLLLLAGCLSYAVLRYAVWGGVAPSQIPAYLANKAVAMAAVGALLGYVVALAKSDDDARQGWGRLAADSIMVHLLLSFPLLNSTYFAKLFGENQLLSTPGSAFLLSGALASVYIFTIRTPYRPRRWKTAAGLLCIGLHTALLGFSGWFTPAQWHGGLPPISLLSFLAATTALFLYLKLLRQAPPPGSPRPENLESL